MKSRYLCLLLLITILVTVGFFNIAYASDNIKWYSYEEGKVLAKVEKKRCFCIFMRIGAFSAEKWPKRLFKMPM